MKRIQIVVACITFGISDHVAQAAIIKNGSFENGFTSWTTADLTTPHQPLLARANGFDTGFGFFVTSATDGTSSATHGFDGNGPGSIVFAQDVGAINMSSVILTFDYRAGWNMLDFAGSTEDRVFTVHLRPEGGGNALASFEVLRAPFGTSKLDTGPQTATINLSPFVGTLARLSFEAFIPQNFTGPALMQVDNVRLSPIPEPGCIAFLTLSLMAVFRRQRAPEWGNTPACLTAGARAQPRPTQYYPRPFSASRSAD